MFRPKVMFGRKRCDRQTDELTDMQRDIKLKYHHSPICIFFMYNAPKLASWVFHHCSNSMLKLKPIGYRIIKTTIHSFMVLTAIDRISFVFLACVVT